MEQKRTSVKCTRCGWRGKRVFRDCACYEICQCPMYGMCPKCGVRVRSIEDLRMEEQHMKLVRQQDACDHSQTQEDIPGFQMRRCLECGAVFTYEELGLDEKGEPKPSLIPRWPGDYDPVGLWVACREMLATNVEIEVSCIAFKMYGFYGMDQIMAACPDDLSMERPKGCTGVIVKWRKP